MVVFVIWYSLQRIVNRHRFLKYTQILRNPTTSEGCKNFSRGLGYTLWVSRRSAWIRAFERTYFHDHSLRRSKKFCEKLIFMQKIKTFHITQNANHGGGVHEFVRFSKKKILKIDFWATIWSQRPQNISPGSLDVSLQDSKKIFMFPPFFEIFWAMMQRSSM